MRRTPALRDAARLPALLSAVLTIFLFSQCLPLVRKPTRLWPGYYTFIMRDGPSNGDALKRFAKERWAGRGVVSLYTAPVSFTDFEGETRCTAADLSGRLDEADPRYDPYLKGIAGYFKSGEWEVAYVPSNRIGLALLLRLRSFGGFTGNRGTRLADVGLFPSVISVLSALGLASILSRSLGGKGGELPYIAHLFALLWLPVLLQSGFSILCFFMLSFTAWFQLARVCAGYARQNTTGRGLNHGAEREIAGRLFLFLLLSFLLPALLALSGIASIFLLFSIASLIFCSLLLLILPFALQELRKAVKRRRAPLDSVLIARKEKNPPWFRQGLVAFSVLSAAGLFAACLARGVPLPIPLYMPGSQDLTWEYLERRARSGTAGRLPDLSDAAAHAAFQQGLSLGRAYGIPGREERVYRDAYSWSREGNNLVRREMTEKKFDSVWLSSIARDARDGSVERMLLEQGTPVVTVMGPWQRELRELPFAFLCLGMLAVLLFSRIDFDLLITGNLWRSNVAARRKR